MNLIPNSRIFEREKIRLNWLFQKYIYKLESENIVTKSTILKYQNILKKIKGYQREIGNKVTCEQVDKAFLDDFFSFLINNHRLLHNTANRYINFIKTILEYHKQNNGVVANNYKNFKQKKQKVIKHILSIDELEAIKRTGLKDHLKEARDWTIIGCYTGQRVSDLLRMEKAMINNINGFDFIILEQVKTKKQVQIPLHKEVQKVLDRNNGNFPKKFGQCLASSSALFNRYIKIICKEAGLTNIIDDYLFNPNTRRKEKVKAPKYKFISSHVCRRSFATNFYGKIPTPLLMNITAHSSEAMFLNYIGKKSTDYSQELAEIWAKG